MGDIKSAREIAMEKINKLGEPTEEELLEWKYLPEGEKLAARYLKNEAQLTVELNKYEKKAARYLSKGISNILIKNIMLPNSDITKKNNKLAIDGIKVVKNNKAQAEEILNQIKQVFNHYGEQGEKQIKQAYAALKADFGAKIEQALRQQGGTMSGVRIDVEKQPQFLEEWRKIKNQLEGQYIQVLNELKQALQELD
jgi:hypothetical protein